MAKKEKATSPQELLLKDNGETVGEMDGRTFTKDQLLVTDKEIFQIDVLTDINTYPKDYPFDESVAYIQGDYFYIYRGEAKKRALDSLRPGIYKAPAGFVSPFLLVEPSTEKEKEEYNIDGKIITQLAKRIIDTANNREELLVAISESNKIFQPILAETDDMLKRLIKKILLAKEVDLDQYKDRFTNKNELFNFKQVVKGTSKLSILVFDRGINALNLYYTITVYEKDPAHAIGKPLIEPITVSSEDTYEM